VYDGDVLKYINCARTNMNDFFKDGIVQALIATLNGTLILGIFGWLKFKRDEDSY
jgi:hypothetical protein